MLTLFQVDLDSIVKALEEYVYNEIEIPRRLNEYFKNTRDTVLRNEAKRITSEFDVEHQKYEMVMRMQEAKHRQNLQRKLLARQEQQIARSSGKVSMGMDPSAMVVRFPSPSVPTNPKPKDAKPSIIASSLPSGFIARGLNLGPMLRK